MLTAAEPIPGKCFAVTATPGRSSAPAKAPPQRETAPGLDPKARRSRPIALPRRATSRTGARSTFTPTPSRLRPVAAPWRLQVPVPARPIWRALIDGGPGSRFTSPPSWSTMIGSGPAIASGRGIDRRRRVIRRTSAREPTLSEKRITPPSRPRRMRRSRSPLTFLPAKPTTIRWPTSWASVSRSAAGGAAACASPPPIAIAVAATIAANISMRGGGARRGAPGRGCTPRPAPRPPPGAGSPTALREGPARRGSPSPRG